MTHLKSPLMLSWSPTNIWNTTTSPWTCTPSRLVSSLPMSEAILNQEEISLKARITTPQLTGVTSSSLLKSSPTLTIPSISMLNRLKKWFSKVSLKVRLPLLNRSKIQLSQLVTKKWIHYPLELREHSPKPTRAFSVKQASLLKQ